MFIINFFSSQICNTYIENKKGNNSLSNGSSFMSNSSTSSSVSSSNIIKSKQIND